jgi:pimeloyl-ACP methyl ester carboxylesterase
MVAYAYAVQFPSETEKLVLMDAFLPGVAGWEPIYNSSLYWHFRFHGPTPEALVKEREDIFFAYFWNDLAADKNHSLPEADRKAYLAAYSRQGRMRAAWEYFASFIQAAKDFEDLSKTKLTMPVLSIGGDKSLGVALGEQAKLVATDRRERCGGTELRPLDYGRTAQANDGCAGEVFLAERTGTVRNKSPHVAPTCGTHEQEQQLRVVTCVCGCRRVNSRGGGRSCAW